MQTDYAALECHIRALNTEASRRLLAHAISYWNGDIACAIEDAWQGECGADCYRLVESLPRFEREETAEETARIEVARAEEAARQADHDRLAAVAADHEAACALLRHEWGFLNSHIIGEEVGARITELSQFVQRNAYNDDKGRAWGCADVVRTEPRSHITLAEVQAVVNRLRYAEAERNAAAERARRAERRAYIIAVNAEVRAWIAAEWPALEADVRAGRERRFFIRGNPSHHACAIIRRIFHPRVNSIVAAMRAAPVQIAVNSASSRSVSRSTFGHNPFASLSL